MGEPGRLARAIDNIIDNAISFSPPGGLVEIAAAHVGDEVRIRVDDEGPGVPEEAREAIFNRFHSVRPEGEDFGRHSGLGLAIARAIVEGHDGEIDVQDRDDAPSGARFTILLPAADRCMSSRIALAPKPSTRAPSRSDGRAVLIAGPSGSGKSDLALRLLDRGFTLVSDDQTIVRRDGDRLIASRPADDRGQARDPRHRHRRDGHVSSDVPVALFVELTSEIQRLPDDSRERPILGVASAADQRRCA